MRTINGLPVNAVVNSLISFADEGNDADLRLDHGETYLNIQAVNWSIAGAFTGVVVFAPKASPEAELDYPECYDEEGPIHVPYLASSLDVNTFEDTLLMVLSWDELDITWDYDSLNGFTPRRLVPCKGRFAKFAYNEQLPYMVETDIQSSFAKKDLGVASMFSVDQEPVAEIIGWINSNARGRWNLFGSTPDGDLYPSVAIGFEDPQDMMLFKLSHNSNLRHLNEKSNFLVAA